MQWPLDICLQACHFHRYNTRALVPHFCLQSGTPIALVADIGKVWECCACLQICFALRALGCCRPLHWTFWIFSLGGRLDSLPLQYCSFSVPDSVSRVQPAFMDSLAIRGIGALSICIPVICACFCLCCSRALVSLFLGCLGWVITWNDGRCGAPGGQFSMSFHTYAHRRGL